MAVPTPPDDEVDLGFFQTTRTAREGLMQPPDACTSCGATGQHLTSRLDGLRTLWLCKGCL